MNFCEGSVRCPVLMFYSRVQYSSNSIQSAVRRVIVVLHVFCSSLLPCLHSLTAVYFVEAVIFHSMLINRDMHWTYFSKKHNQAPSLSNGQDIRFSISKKILGVRVRFPAREATTFCFCSRLRRTIPQSGSQFITLLCLNQHRNITA